MYPKHMGRLSAVCLSIMLALQLTACSGGVNTVENTETSSDTEVSLTEKAAETSDEVSEVTAESVSAGAEQLKELRENMAGTDYIAAVCFLGFYEGETSDAVVTFSERYPIVASIPEENWVTAEGNDFYCVVPRDENAAITVKEWIVDESNDYMGAGGNVLYQNDKGAPIIVRGNISEIVPNIDVCITESEELYLEFIPERSMRDDTLIVPDTKPYILDFTDYSDRVLDNTSRGEEQLYNIMESMNGTDYIAAICFIGYAESETDDVIDVCCENYPVAALIPQERWAIADGDELYCIIPADDSVTVAVNEYVWDADLDGGVGNELCRSENGEPVLLRGNISAGLPNLEAVVTRGDVSVTFSPCMDIYDHKIELYSDFLPYIMDATDYSKELPLKLNGINTFGVPSEEVRELVSQNIDKGMYFPFETELVECSWSVTADSDWVMELFVYDNYYPYAGYIKIYKMPGENDENLYEGSWAIEDGCLALNMHNFIGDQVNTIHDAFPILVQYDDTGMSMMICKGNGGTLLPFMVSGEIYAELSQTLG